jgi:N-acetylneuraminic acid mutarotase
VTNPGYNMPGVVVGGYLYYGMGNSPYNNKWYKMNLINGVSTELASFPLPDGLVDHVLFKLGNDIYCGAGSIYAEGPQTLTPSKRFFRYSIAQNSWTEITPYPGTGATGMVSFVLGNEAFVGMGQESRSTLSAPNSEMYKYVQGGAPGGTWTQIAHFGNSSTDGYTKRNKAVAFCDGNRAIVGGGEDVSGNATRTFYEYNKATNTWASIAHCPSTGFILGQGVAINSKFYLLNSSQELLEYNPQNNEWKILPEPGRPYKVYGSGFGYNNRLYYFGGVISDPNRDIFYIPNR